MSDIQTQDAELMARVRRQDRSALEALYERHARYALGLATKLLNERAVAEEVVQEAFWRVWHNAATFDASKGHFLTWLLSVVRHLAIDELRRRRGKTTRDIMDTADERLQQELVSPLDVGEQAWANLLKGKVQAAMTQLPDAQRKVIELAYFEGLSHHEISLKLAEPLGTVHTRMRLGLSKLREALSDLRSPTAS